MLKTKILLGGLAIAVLSGCLLFFSKHALATGELVKGELPAVYYITSDNKRLAFPDLKTYLSWYSDFSNVRTIANSELVKYPLAGVVTMRPGIKLVKIVSDPKVYAVASGGVLRWITTENIARSIYGTSWNKQVVDIPVSFFTNYSIGADVTGEGAVGAYSVSAEQTRSSTIDAEHSATLLAKNQTPAQENSVSTCKTPACLADHQALPYTGSSATKETFLLAPGKSQEILPNIFARTESKTMGSIWLKKDGSCFIKQATITEEGYPGKTIVGDKIIIFNTEGDSMRFNVYGGSGAYNECIKANAEAYGRAFCEGLPKSGSYIISGEKFDRVFAGNQYAPAQSLSVDVDDVALNRLIDVFSFITKAQSFTGKWHIANITSDQMPNQNSGIDEGESILARSDFVLDFASGKSTFLKEYSTDGALYSTALNFIKGGVATSFISTMITGPFIAELHEFSHGIFGNTALGNFAPKEDAYGRMLVEGWANYLGNTADASASERQGWSQRYCGDTQFLNPPENYSDMLLTDYYKAGMCFYSAVEKACGTPTINGFIADILMEPSSPQSLSKHPMMLLRDRCPDKQKYDQILTNFGISKDKISTLAPLAPGVLPGNACQTQ